MASLTIPNIFTAGTPALASEVNANFTAVVNWSTGLDQDNMTTFTGDLAFTIANGNAIVIQNNGNDESIKITQGALLGAGKASILITDNQTQTVGDAELKMVLAAGATIPAIHITHGVDTFKLTKDSLNLFNDSTKVSSDRIKLPVKTTAQRNALVAPDEASVLYNTDTNQVNIKRSDTWVPIEVPVGCVQMYVMSTAPEGWLVCDGTEYLKSAYPKLNTVLSNSNTYPYGETNGSGGVGTTHFRVPDMRRRVPMGAGGSVPAGAPVTTNTLGSTGGTETVTLDITQIPSHTHRWFITGSAFPPSTTNAAAASGAAQGIANTGFPVDPNTAGGGLSHSNTQPSLVLNYIIKY